MDPVHGGIPFFEHEEHVIDHPLFQRLRFILQTDILFLVFPGATHTRFQHSMGSMHIAGRVFKSLVRSYLVDPKRAGAGRMSDRQRGAIQYFNACLRLAALLHDTGHGPFSHQFRDADVTRQILAEKSTFSALWPKNAWQLYYTAPPTVLSHEHYSVWCAHKILSDVLKDGFPNLHAADIIALLETTDCLPSKEFTEHAREFLPLFLRPGSDLSQLSDTTLVKAIQQFFRTLISGEIDVDKMDYLLRDSFFSGCQYGVYNLDHLLIISHQSSGSGLSLHFSLRDLPPFTGPLMFSVH